MRRVPVFRRLTCLALLPLAACTGLTAGPEVSAVTPVPASKDSAWVRTKRALTTEVFTLDVQDSLGGRLTAMRYPSATAKPGTAAACRVGLALAIEGSADRASLASTSRWLAPEVTSATNAQVCEQDRQETLDRILQVVAPAAN
jgi:hypothetical protein